MKKSVSQVVSCSSNGETEFSKNSSQQVLFRDEDKIQLDNYQLDDYYHDININGLKKTWDKINYYILHYNTNNDFLDISNFSNLYEAGLAFINKQQKKNGGKYYTPEDVASVMSTWFNELDGFNICDVGCGTGNLTLSYLEKLGFTKAKELINAGRLYLYDIDEIALNICKTIILKKYGKELASKVNLIHCDFLNQKIVLPDNCKVICNPPYSMVTNLAPEWHKTKIASDTKECYAMFMEKIIRQSVSSVLITPYSFIGGKKFYALRLLMNNYNGFIVSFDNVPGNIFNGTKYGIFNSNTSNSVRAAITVVKNESSEKGFKLTPLIRFKNNERKGLLNSKFLENFISDKVQLINYQHTAYAKCNKELQNIFDKWIATSQGETVNDLITLEKTNYELHIPNTCRYFTTAAVRELKRVGMINLFVQNQEKFEFLYCLINSSFAYWWWRIFDGGITYQVGLLKKMPTIFNQLDISDKEFFHQIFNKMKKNETNCMVTKLNSGSKQENIKFPSKYREKINQRLLKILGCSENYKLLNRLHMNNVFNKGENNA